MIFQHLINGEVFRELRVPRKDHSDLWELLGKKLIEDGTLTQLQLPKFLLRHQPLLWRTFRNKRNNTFQSLRNAIQHPTIANVLGIGVSLPPSGLGPQALTEWVDTHSNIRNG